MWPVHFRLSFGTRANKSRLQWDTHFALDGLDARSRYAHVVWPSSLFGKPTANGQASESKIHNKSLKFSFTSVCEPRSFEMCKVSLNCRCQTGMGQATNSRLEEEQRLTGTSIWKI